MRIFPQLETSRLATPVRCAGRALHKSPSAKAIVQMAVLKVVFLCLMLFAGMLLLLEVGLRIGVRFGKARGGEAASIFASANLALPGLLPGFAFAGAVDRLDKRRDLIVADAKDISTACLRLDMLAPDDQPAIRELLRHYLRARVRVCRVIDAERDHAPAFDTAERLHAKIWTATVAAVEKPDRQDAAEAECRRTRPAGHQREHANT